MTQGRANATFFRDGYFFLVSLPEKGEVARAKGDGEKNEGVYYRVQEPTATG